MSMRRIITLTAGITLAVTVSAQTLSSNVKVPRPQALAWSSPSKMPSRKMGNFTMTKFKPLPKPHFETAPRAPRLVDTDGDITTKDTLLAVGHLKKGNYDDDEYQSESVTYDKYGRRSTYTKYNRLGEVSQTYKYTYEVGPFNFWTTKYVQVKERWDNDWTDYEKEEREIDENKNITRKKIYTLVTDYDNYDPNTGNYPEKLVLRSDVRYDYAHANKENGQEKRGYEVERCTYNDDGTLETHNKYEWSELAQDYILVLSDDNVYKTEAIFNDNNIEYNTYLKQEDGTLWFTRKNINYYENGKYVGYKQTSYKEDGSIEYAYGYKKIIEHDVPSTGWTTETSYDYNQASDSFIPTSRTEYIGENSGNSYIASNYSANYYSYKGGEWVYNYSLIQEILDNRIYKITQKNESREYVEYKKLDEANNIIGSVTYNDDGSYQVRNENKYDNEHKVNYRFIEYYDANSTLLKTVCAVEGLRKYLGIDGYRPDDDSEIYTYYEKKGNNWEAVKEYEVKGGSYDGFNMRKVYQFTDDGYPSTITQYVQNSSYNGGKEFASEKIVYTYADNGYKVDEYSVWSPTDLSLQMEGCNTYYILEDGGLEHTYFEYDDEYAPGTIVSGERTVTYEDGGRDNYTYNKVTGEWTLLNSYRPDFQEYVYDYPDDDTEIVTQRRQGDNGEIINVAKSVTYNKYEDDYDIRRNEEYEWDEANNEWKGVNKSEKTRETVRFGKNASNPISQYDDEYMPHEVDNEQDEASYYFESSKYYAWNENAKDWQLYIKEGEDNNDYTYKIDGNKFTYVVTTTDNDAIRKYNNELEVNSERYIVSESRTEQYTNRESGESEENKYVKSYTYNKYGKWAEVEEEHLRDGNTISTNYEKFIYEEASILPTLIEQLPLSEAAKGIKVDGLKVSHEGIILLYNADGRLTAKGNGFVIAPEPGLYVIKAGGKTLKMVLK